MSFERKMYFYIVCISIFLTSISANVQRSKHGVEILNDENWDRMLTGEWMVEFYAPWCPACKSLEPIWDHLASWKKDLNIEVGKVDVTNAPGLSGRFMVTALPTIYHVKDGIFRQYKSPRDKDSVIEFVMENTWMKVDPIPSWKSPTSIMMSVISYFFRLSQVLRGIHSRLTEDFGLPTWASYFIFAIATIVQGAILGLIIVCIIDFIYPPKNAAWQSKKKCEDCSVGSGHDKGSGDEELVENVKDDLVDEEGSDAEKADEDKDTKASPNSPNVRKRKPRKAD